MTFTWSCHGPAYPPTPCDATGTTDRGAAKHVADTKHCTSTHDRRTTW